MTKLMNILGIIVGLLGLIFGMYSYFSNQKKSEISYNIYSPSFKIYDSEITREMSSLNLFFGDSLKIRQNVYLTTFSIWNTGDLSINKNDIRKKIDIEFDGVGRILDLRTIKEVERGISNIKLSAVTNLSYCLDWDYFDPNNGLKIQLIYIGEEKVKCKVNGYILGTNIKEFIPIQNVRDIPGRKTSIFILLGTILITVIITIMIIINRRKNVRLPISKSYRTIIIFTLVNIGYGFFIIYYFFVRVQEIPF